MSTLSTARKHIQDGEPEKVLEIIADLFPLEAGTDEFWCQPPEWTIEQFFPGLIDEALGRE